jgi:hypothetical protein
LEHLELLNSTGGSVVSTYNDREKITKVHKSMGFGEEIQHFISCVKLQQSPYTSGHEEIKSLEMELNVREIFE